MKKIIITGVAGFIGSHLADYFLKKNFQVIGYDNLITGSTNNIKHNFKEKNFTFFEIDICNKITIDEKIDYILHFASPASPIDYLKFPIETLEVGSVGTKNMLDLAKKNDATILVASTSEVYGDPLEHPQKESYYGNVNPIGPRAVYDESKRFLEAITSAYERKFKLNTRIARIFNTYGPRMRKNDGRVIPNFINQSIKNEDFTIYGNGSQTRCFCYIDDTVEAIYNLLMSDHKKPINIGSKDEFSMLELLELIKKTIPTTSKTIFMDLPKNDPKKRRPDITTALEILNWKPKTKIQEGLLKTYKYFNEI